MVQVKAGMNMSRTNTATKQNTSGHSLLDAFGAVEAALATMPDEALNTRTDMAEAFLVADPVLATLKRQKADADSNYKKLVRTYGFNDAMVEAQSFQRAAIEEAYATRLAALRRRRGETQGSKGQVHVRDVSDEGELKLQGITRKATEDRLRNKREEDRLLAIAQDEQRANEQRNDTLWLWAFLMLITSRKRADYQPRPALMPV
jgi:hypothetical protein